EDAATGAGRAVAGEGAVGDRQRAAVEDGTAHDAGAAAVGDGQVLDRERDGGVHREHAHRSAAADGNQAPTVNGGVGANGLRAGDGNRGGAAAGERHGAVEIYAAREAGVQPVRPRLGATRTTAGADDTRE